jgi:YfiR/HmsC-like
MTMKKKFLFRLFVCLLGLTALFWCMPPAQCAVAQSRQPTEYEVKAAFLYNFAKFAEWPADAFSGPDAPFVFGILGRDPFGAIIDAVEKRTVNGRTVQVRRFSDVQDIRKCHILYISSSETERLGTILRTLAHASTLLVSDSSTFVDRGGAIGFVVLDNSVGFKINTDAVLRAGITIHSRLLKMAIIVHDDPKWIAK